MPRTRWFLVLLFAAVTVVTPARAEQESVRVVTETWPPLRISSIGELAVDFTGIDIDLLKLLAERLDIRFSIQRLPWARCLDFMRTGEADLITGLAYTEQRAEFIRYSSLAYYTVAPVFYTLKGSGHLIQTYEDLYRFRIGYSINYENFEPFKSDTKLDKIGVSNDKKLLKMLILGHLDVIIGNDPHLSYDLVQQGLRDQVEKTAYTPVQITELFVGISRKSKLMSRADELDAILGQLVRSGEVDRLAAKYF